MTQLDPHTYPDRFVFEARARQLRDQEIEKLRLALGEWIKRQLHALAASLTPPTSVFRDHHPRAS